MKAITDQRQSAKVLHRLEDILFAAVVATIANAGCWEEVADFVRGRKEWFSRYIDLGNGVPSHDTFERVFRWIDGQEFERCFILWMREICTESNGMRVIAIDGKTMRGSGDTSIGRKPLHIVSAWTDANNMVLGQVKTEEKSNEITAIPALLALLDVKGAIVTIDAMGTQKEIAGQIVRRKADYVLSVKGNQPTMLEDIQLYFETEISTEFEGISYERHMTVEKGHGRLEKREYWLTDDIGWISWKKEWKSIGGIGRMRRTVTKGQKTTKETAYFITTLSRNVGLFARAVRGHWGIESMHGSLDVVLNEDKRTVHKDKEAQNLSVLKRIALNIIRADQGFEKATGPRKRFRASWDSKYLESVLQNL